MMTDIIKQALAELKSIGNILHGPEIWLAFPLFCLAGFAIGFLIFYHWGDNND